jgi:regulator of sigma E protease
MGSVLFTVLVLVVVLGILVFVHELGHYLAAKAFGVWVHRFAIGIGKPVRIGGKTWSFHRGETEWAIAWLPLGGYVKMASREEDPASSVLEGHSAADVPPDRVFEAKPIWQRMVIILAGVTLNALFAWMVFSGLAWKNGRHFNPTTTIGHVNARRLPPEARELASLPDRTRIVAINGHEVHSWDEVIDRITASSENDVDLTFANHAPVSIPLHRDALLQRAQLATEALEPQQPPVVGGISPGYPAAKVGFAVGDSIIAVGTVPVATWSDAVEQIQESAGQEIVLTVVRNGKQVQVAVTPRADREVPGDSTSAMIGRIGLAPRSDYQTESLGLFGAIQAGGGATLDAAGTIYRTLRGLVSRNVAISNVGGPILIGQMAADQARLGLEPLLAFMAIISINLAVVNLLPIPVLDGGAFLILLVEGIIRRSLPSRLREAVSLVGLALVVLLMVVAFRNDIARLLTP